MAVTGTGKKVDDWLLDQFVKLSQRPQSGRPPSKTVAIISTPRCGSKFICGTLSATGRFGDASEWLNPRRVQAYGRLFELEKVDVQRYLNYVISRTVTSNGVFSLNFHVDQYLFWKKQRVDLLAVRYDRIIYLYRRDKLAQAHSLAKALATDQWRSNMEPGRNVDATKITNSMIFTALQMISTWEDLLNEHLSERIHGRYCYEDFVADPGNFRALLDECGIQHDDIDSFSCDFEVQSYEADRARLRDLKNYLGGEFQPNGSGDSPDTQ